MTMETAAPPISLGTEDGGCPICLEPLPKIAATVGHDEDYYNILDIAQLVKCGHTFHQSCLNTHEEMQSNAASCPLCRASLLSNNSGEILAWTANKGGMRFAINLATMFDSDRFYRDNPDIAKQEAIAAGEDVDLIQELIREGVDVNSSFEDGNSGLMMATMNGRNNVIQCFLDNGVNVNAVSLFGQTALDTIDEALGNHQETKDLLQGAGALPASEVCANCGQTTRQPNPPCRKLKRCSRCKKIHYCTVTCQKGHWSKHREYCLWSS